MDKSHKQSLWSNTKEYILYDSIYIKFKNPPNKLWYKKLRLCLSLGEGVWELDWELVQKDFKDAGNILFLDLNVDYIAIISKIV